MPSGSHHRVPRPPPRRTRRGRARTRRARWLLGRRFTCWSRIAPDGTVLGVRDRESSRDARARRLHRRTQVRLDPAIHRQSLCNRRCGALARAQGRRRFRPVHRRDRHVARRGRYRRPHAGILRASSQRVTGRRVAGRRRRLQFSHDACRHPARRFARPEPGPGAVARPVPAARGQHLARQRPRARACHAGRARRQQRPGLAGRAVRCPPKSASPCSCC